MVDVFGISLTTYLASVLIGLVIFQIFRIALLPYEVSRWWNLPCPELKPFIGHLHHMTKLGIWGMDYKFYLEYKTKHKAFCTLFFMRPSLVICDLDVLKHVLVKEFHAFTNRHVPNINSAPTDLGLIFTEGDHWKNIRNFVSPAFSSGKLRAMNSLLLSRTERLVERLQKETSKTEPTSMKEVFGAFTLDVIACTMFGLDIDAQTLANDQFTSQAKHAFNVGHSNLFLSMGMLFPSLCPAIKRWGRGFITHEAVRFFHHVIQTALKLRRDENNNQQGKYVDFLQMAVRQEVDEGRIDRQATYAGQTYRWSSEGLLTEEIEAQAVGFFLAGYETTATSLTFLAYILACHQEVCDSMLEEIEEQIGEEPPNYDNIKKLKYMDMCISECLRLFPPSLRAMRKASKSIDLFDIHIPEETSITIPIYAIHRDPDLWPDPHKFIPERFTPEEKAKRHAFSYLPFGLGPRSCVGMRLAQFEMKMALTQILRHFRFLPTDRMLPVEQLELAPTGLLAPKHDIRIHVKPRS